MPKRILIFIFCSIHFIVCAQDSLIRSGLYFSSHEVIQDRRTSLHLTSEKTFHFKKSFAMEFDAQFRGGDGYYGLIFRIIGNEEVNIDLISNLGTERSNFWLVIKDSIPFSFDFEEITDTRFENWIKIRIDFDLENSNVSVTFNDVKKESHIDLLSELNTFDIIFGASANPRFLNTDVSPMSLNNIVIYDKGNKVYRNWKLEKHTEDAVYDELQKTRAKVKNGTWLIDKHIKWESLGEVNVPDLLGVAKNEKEGIIYLIGQRAVCVYDVPKNTYTTINYEEGQPFYNYSDHFIYYPEENKIISYHIDTQEFNVFDFETRKWTHSESGYKEPDYAHHNKIISPIDGNILTFGGYGHYKYKSLLNIYNIQNKSWKTIDFSDKIYPRYLAASGLAENNEWYIFGGYGSKSGRQQISPQSFYDLYSLNLETFELNKICEYPTPEIPFVPCETLVKRPGSNSFYTLLYNTTNFTTSLQLAEFFIDEPKYVVYPDVIPYNFSDIESWCTFFVYEATSKIVVATIHKSDVKIYTMAFPPLQKKDVIQNVKAKASWPLWILIALAVLVFVVLTIIKTKKAKSTQDSSLINAVSEAGNGFEQTLVEMEIPKTKSKSSIYLLGGFQVFDKEGNDITAQFTPTLKLLFIIILLYMVKNGRGISTTKLNETLWFDKSENSARNNRNVSISKLRGILDKVGNMDIEQDSSYWRVKMEGIYCDYVEITNLFQKFKAKNTALSENEILRFLQVVSRGELLPNVQLDWVDDFKADFSNMVIDTLIGFAALPEIEKNSNLLNYVADAIFKYDSINEDAIGFKCVALYRLGKIGLAKSAYDSFVKEYKNLLGTNFSLSFKEIIEEEGE